MLYKIVGRLLCALPLIGVSVLWYMVTGSVELAVGIGVFAAISLVLIEVGARLMLKEIEDDGDA